MLGHGELAIIVLVILILFGASAIPKFARSLGQAKKEFSKAAKEAEDEPPEKTTEKTEKTEKTIEEKDDYKI